MVSTIPLLSDDSLSATKKGKEALMIPETSFDSIIIAAKQDGFEA